MTKHVRLPLKSHQPGPKVPLVRNSDGGPRYYAFLSYSHKDGDEAEWLQRELERFRVPAGMAGKLTHNGVVPKRLIPIFRDEHELPASGDLGQEIEAALSASQYLIVLCSPDGARSRWINAEIETFRRARPEGCVLAAIAAGEPFASDEPGRESEECFPAALRHKYDRRGKPTSTRAEPLAADLRDNGDGRRMGLLKLIAGMLGVGLDELVRRETTRRHRRVAWLAAASLGGMAVTTTLAVTAIHARDAARDERREAEGLVAFMLGDLKNKLEPIGRLDALDGVGSRVLAYYAKQQKTDLSDPALVQRSRALSLMGQLAFLRGQMSNAERLYREAAAGTGEIVGRRSHDPQPLFDHAQNVFWLAVLAGEQGRLDKAERGYSEYKNLAARMIQLDPDNMKWRMEAQYADENLGIVLLKQRRFTEAGTEFEEARQNIQALCTADPHNNEYQRSLATTLAWLADARMSQGKLRDAAALREQQLTVLQSLFQSSSDVNLRSQEVQAEQALGRLFMMLGDPHRARQHLQIAVQRGDDLAALEPHNTVWLLAASATRFGLADQALDSGNETEAIRETSAGCAIVNGSVAQTSTYVLWRGGQRDCAALRARIALISGNSNQAVQQARQAVALAKYVRSSDPSADQFAFAKMQRLLGDAEGARGNAAAAQISWKAAAAALPGLTGERPSETSERQIILQRLGRAAEAAQLKARLASIGYRLTRS